MLLTGIDKPKIYSEEIIKNLENLTSILEPGDIMICILQDKDWGALHDFVKWMIRDPDFRDSDFCHIMFYSGFTSAGELLILEERKPRGARLGTIDRHIGRPAEVYRIDHPYQKEFCKAILQAGKQIAESENAFFDYFGIPRMILQRLGIDLKFRLKFNQLYSCPEYIRVCFERARELLDKNLIEVYEKDILEKMHLRLPFYKIPNPADFAKLEFCKKVWEGRIGYPPTSETSKGNKNIFLKIGHRGAMGYEPENTLLSFQKALKLGVDAVELDVYCCKTGELVVIHDDKVDRTTNGEGYVVEKTFAELRSFDAGKGQKIPTLEEVLDLIDKKAAVVIELKGINTAGPVSKTLKKYIQERSWSADLFWISSFNHYELREFHNLYPEIKIGALITGIPLGYAEFAEKLGAKSLNLCVEFVNQEFVDSAHQRGMKVFVWTVNDPEEIKRIKALGVDGIFSNFPDRL